MRVVVWADWFVQYDMVSGGRQKHSNSQSLQLIRHLQSIAKLQTLYAISASVFGWRGSTSSVKRTSQHTHKQACNEKKIQEISKFVSLLYIHVFFFLLSFSLHFFLRMLVSMCCSIRRHMLIAHQVNRLTNSVIWCRCTPFKGQRQSRRRDNVITVKK